MNKCVQAPQTEKRWLRFNYVDPQPIHDVITGQPTGEYALILKAVRSDGYLYCAQIVLEEEDVNRPQVLLVARESLRSHFEPWLEDNPQVPQLPPDSFKGNSGWEEVV